MLQRLRDRELDARAKVTELDIDQFLRDQQQGAGDPALTDLNLAHILVAVPESATRRRGGAGEAKAKQLRSARAAARTS